MKMSKIESGLRIVLEFNEAFNRHDIAGLTRLMSDDCIFETTNPAPDGTVHAGKEAVTQYLQGFFQASPNARMEIEEVFGMGIHCILRWKYTWADETGNKGHIRGVDIFQIKDGLISEKFSYVKG